MEDDKRVNYKLDAINKLINNLKLSISGNKEHDELGENNVIVNLDEISQKITELHEMVKAEFDEFENQHKSESDETQTLSQVNWHQLAHITHQLSSPPGRMY